MKKKAWCLAVAVWMFAGRMLNAYAAEPADVGEGWKAWFTGEKIESNFSDEDIINAIGAMQPDDSVTLKIEVENQDETASNWYMRNEVLESLEKKGSPASGGAYTYRLVYQNAQGNETIFFDSDTVGGEDSESGLREATDGMDEWFFLDQLAQGKSGTIWLTVALDGETIANNYQNTLAELELAFAVEPDQTPLNSGGSGSSTEYSGVNGTVYADSNVNDRSENGGTAGNRVYSSGKTRTGDTGSVMLWSMLSLVCGLSLMVYGIAFYKKEKGEG